MAFTDFGLERPLDLEQVDRDAVVGREHLGGEDGQTRQRERSGDHG